MSDLEALCRSCGLCCDGSLFGRVPLAPSEVPSARKVGLRVIASEKSFEQPCNALGQDRACAIYRARPAACRSFTCRLLGTHAREGGALEPRLAIVRRTRELLGDAHATREASAELVALLEAHFARNVM
ncbi:MAG TPA: YkgJ family cysteine cluster protein [Polyangiaceae bacterium]|jgi:hypothetical protein|nr:YkgJ family cysteine cluster protein [Polyangiaceae bacterium]